jgi:hypothetical protein
VYAVAGGNLIRFTSDNPGTILSSTAISGLGLGETVAGLDFRPATGELYAIATAAGASAHLYRLNPDTGAATAVTPLGSPVLPAAAAFGMDFSPVADDVRVVTDADDNMRFDPGTGALTTDPDLAGNPTIVALAYSNNKSGATTTTAYVIDSAADRLARLGGPDGNPSPNSGALTTIGPLGIDVGTGTGFDIAASDGRAYLASGSRLGIVDLGTGAVSSTQTIGASNISAMALGLGGQQSFSTNITFLKESDGKVVLPVNRTGGVGTASVDVATADGTAHAGSDYGTTSGTIVFGPGDTTQTVTIPIINDSATEQTEAFAVNLSNPKLGSLGDNATEYVVIVDDDPAPPPPPPPPPPDKTAPAIAIGKVAGRILKAFPVPFACSEPCKARFEVRPRASDRKRYKLSTVIGRATKTLKAAGKGNTTVALTKLTRRRLKGVKRLVVTLRMTATDTAGNAKTLNAKLTLRR